MVDLGAVLARTVEGRTCEVGQSNCSIEWGNEQVERKQQTKALGCGACKDRSGTASEMGEGQSEEEKKLGKL